MRRTLPRRADSEPRLPCSDTETELRRLVSDEQTDADGDDERPTLTELLLSEAELLLSSREEAMDGEGEEARPTEPALSREPERTRSAAARPVLPTVSVGDDARPTLRRDADPIRADSTRFAISIKPIAADGISSQWSPMSLYPLGDSSDDADEGDNEFATLAASQCSAPSAPADEPRSRLPALVTVRADGTNAPA
jgi:hypothetical protein